MLVTLSLLAGLASPQEPAPRDLSALLSSEPRLRAVLGDAKQHRLQVLLSEFLPRNDGTIAVTRSFLGDAGEYFYPASSVKICAAVAACLELNAWNREHGSAVGLATPFVVEPHFDGDVEQRRDAQNLSGGLITFGQQMRELFPKATHTSIPSAGHCAHLENPSPTARAIHAFLGDL